jgi:hypothetical protein
VDKYHQEQLKERKMHKLRPIADKPNVKHRTLANLVAGKTSMSVFNTSKKKLTDQEEHVMLDSILEPAN